MKTQLTSILAGFCLSGCLILSTAAADQAAGLDPLQGKWFVAKTNPSGNAYSQIIEIRKDQLTFQILDAQGQLRMAAKGTIKAEQAGPFEVLVLSNIRGGRSMEEMEPVDDSRALVYALRDGNLFIASNFDKERNREKPSADTYVHKESPAETAAGATEDEAKVLGTWKLQLTMGDNTRDYGLRIAKGNSGLTGVLISPRSGEHECKLVQWKDGQLVVEVEREIQGNQATVVCRGRLTAEGLAGKVSVKGSEDQYSGTWTATK